jgi:predicted RNase H-like nuclease (RuvC/YqgF family)
MTKKGKTHEIYCNVTILDAPKELTSIKVTDYIGHISIPYSIYTDNKFDYTRSINQLLTDIYSDASKHFKKIYKRKYNPTAKQLHADISKFNQEKKEYQDKITKEDKEFNEEKEKIEMYKKQLKTEEKEIHRLKNKRLEELDEIKNLNTKFLSEIIFEMDTNLIQEKLSNININFLKGVIENIKDIEIMCQAELFKRT